MAEPEFPYPSRVLKLTCKLKFPDGQFLVAILKTELPHEPSPFDCQGAIDRLHGCPEIGDALDFKVIKVMFRSLAREHQAHPEFQEEGEFDSVRNFLNRTHPPATVDDWIASKHFWGKFVESD